jgi:hypothetical protein
MYASKNTLSMTNLPSLIFFLGISLPQVASESVPMDSSQCDSVTKIWRSLGGDADRFCCYGGSLPEIPGITCIEDHSNGSYHVQRVTKIDWSDKSGSNSKILTGKLTGEISSAEVEKLEDLEEL